MRNSFLKMLVLFFAMGSIACACPGLGESDTGSSGHSAHAMHQDAQTESQGNHDAQPGTDCCDECDGNVETAVQDTRPAKTDVDPQAAIQLFAAISRHDAADPPGRRPPDLATPLAEATPVSLRDRMLD